MDFWAIGSVSQYAKAQARKTQWNLKRQNGDFTSHKKSLRDDLSFGRISDLLPERDEENEKMSAILTKVQAGKKLSHSEWEYIREKNPTLYEKLKQVEKEAKDYEEALRRCKTRDEAQRLHVSKLGEILEAAKQDGEGALYRLNRMTETMTDFTKSKDYHELPTEAEEAIEREGERKAKAEARREEAAAKEAEKEAERESGMEEAKAEESKAEAGRETGPEEDRAEKRAEFAAERKEKAVSRAERKAKSAAERRAKAVSKAKRKAGSGTGDGAKAGEGAKSVSGIGNTPAISFGRQAYLKQQSEDSSPRRRRIDAEA